MNQTHQTNQIFQSMTPARKLQLSLSLYHTARRLKRAGLQHQHPDWDQKKLEEKLREVFLYART